MKEPKDSRSLPLPPEDALWALLPHFPLPYSAPVMLMASRFPFTHIQIIPPQCYNFFVLPRFGFRGNYAGLYFIRVHLPLYSFMSSLSLSHSCPSSKAQKERSESSSFLSFEAVSLISFTGNSPGLPDSVNLRPFVRGRLHLDRLPTSCTPF